MAFSFIPELFILLRSNGNVDAVRIFCLSQACLFGVLFLHAVSYTHLRAHETPEPLVCRLLLATKPGSNSYVVFCVYTHQLYVRYLPNAL